MSRFGYGFAADMLRMKFQKQSAAKRACYFILYICIVIGEFVTEFFDDADNFFFIFDY